MKNSRIYLSPPNVGTQESEMLFDVMKDGWISSVGPSLDLFEADLEKIYAAKKVLALNSGTSALHLALVLSGVGRADTVLVSTFTFAASVNVILYQGATPVFIDSEKETWNLDPGLLLEYLQRTQQKPKALIVTHLYGVPAQIEVIKRICKEYEIILIEDAAEAVGSSFNGKPLGSFGDLGILSFNGNKIITTSGGGALITNGEGYKKGLHLATQANSGKSDYYHSEVGYNYRMSNVLAGMGVVQLQRLEEFVSKKRAIFDYYKDHLSAWFDFPVEPDSTFCNRWLTTLTSKTDMDMTRLIIHLDESNIESRRLWRPLHLHPAYSSYGFEGSAVAEELYNKGICLPSGTGITFEELDYVIERLLEFMKKKNH